MMSSVAAFVSEIAVVEFPLDPVEKRSSQSEHPWIVWVATLDACSTGNAH